MMATIDDALNSIWHVRNRRTFITRFLVYWAIMTRGPLLVGVSLISTCRRQRSMVSAAYCPVISSR